MKRVDREDRRARLHALLFARADAATTLRTSADEGPKLPPFVGE
jgi:hypothetical protein